MEYFDIVNINGEVTEKIAAKGTPLESGQYLLGVHAYVYNSQFEFLLQQRSFEKELLPGEWDVHLGHVIAGETSLQGILREVFEEVGLRIAKEDARFVGRVVREKYHHIVDVYFMQTDFRLDELVLQEGEVVAAKLVSADEMLKWVLNSKNVYRHGEYQQLVSAEIERLMVLQQALL